MTDVDIGKALSSALAPVFLISGVSVLLGSMGVRYGRVVDRARVVLREAKASPSTHRPADVDAELRVLLRRGNLLRLTVISASASIFSVSLCIFLLFLTTLLDITLPFVVPTIFSVGLIFLIVSLALFIEDFALSLGALKSEIRVALGRPVSEEKVPGVAR